MTIYGTAQILAFVAIILLVVRPLGGYIARVFNGERTPLHRLLCPLERLIYRACRVNPASEQSWGAYTAAMLAFSLVGVLALFVLQLLQGVLPLNPEGFGAIAPDLALNTAVSFVTNTNWQSYSPESTLSYFVQMAGLTAQNFVSAAVGMSAAMVLIRGFARGSSATVGNFWADIVRIALYLLLPVCVLYSLALVVQGVPQNLNAYESVQTLDGGVQVIAQGPVASQEAIKMFGTNGGGFFAANSAHPYENPTPLTNMLQMLSIFAIGASMTNTFGRMVRDERQGWAILATMAILFLAGLTTLHWAESSGSPVFERSGIELSPTPDQSGGNMEGKEVRFGITATALFATLTTDAACGAVNGMHASFTPIGGAVSLFNIQLGEVVVGGVGAGLYGVLLFAILAVFIAGLMVGRTPEYVGKKIESREMKMTVMALVLVLPLSILGFTALASVSDAGIAGPLDKGPHGFTEILYAYSSATGNNGSGFAGLAADSPFYNLTMALAMLIGRFLVIVPVMAIAGSLAAKEIHPPSSGTFPTTGPLWITLLAGTIIVVGGLTYFSSLVLGPIAEHLMMAGGTF